ncbi:MAG TPA: CorA family divalent cation transporter, partial [Casimicrobiaceae bacterium]
MLVNCVAYQNGRKLADIPIEDISEYVSRPDCFVWVAINDPDEGELEQMQEEFGLHELAVEDAKRPHQRPKLDEYGEDLFAVLRTVERETPDGELIQGQVAVFVGRNYVLSVRQNVRKGFADVRAR